MKFNENQIKNLMPKLIQSLKEDRLTKEQIIQIYTIYKRHQLSQDELLYIDIIVESIKNGKLTEQELIDRAINWNNSFK